MRLDKPCYFCGRRHNHWSKAYKRCLEKESNLNLLTLELVENSEGEKE